MAGEERDEAQRDLVQVAAQPHELVDQRLHRNACLRRVDAELEDARMADAVLALVAVDQADREQLLDRRVALDRRSGSSAASSLSLTSCD